MLVVPNPLNQAPEGFYVATSEEIYQGLIRPEFMTLAELDQAIEFGLSEYERLNPPDKDWFSKWMPVIAAIAVGGVAVAMVAAPIAAAGAATAATQAGAAAAATGTVATAGASFPPITAAGAFAAAQKGAALVSVGGTVYKGVTGKNDADKLIQGANIIQKSPDVTKAATTIFNAEMAARGQKIQTEQAKKALRERIQREQQLYAEYMRRQGYQLQEEITGGIVPGTLPEPRPAADWATVAMAATPFLLLFLGQR